MTPQEMLLRRRSRELVIEDCKRQIRLDAQEASKCQPPKHLRRAKESDIVPGAIIWFPKYRWGSKWQIVQEAISPSHRNRTRTVRFLAAGVIWSLKGARVEIA